MQSFTEQVSITSPSTGYALEVKNTNDTFGFGIRVKAGNSPTMNPFSAMDKDGAHRLFTVDGVGNVMISDSQLPTDAVSGFLCISQCAGAPTGTPSKGIAAPVPMVFDVVNLKLWIYSADGVWHFCQFT